METHIATVEIVLKPGVASSPAEACDWFSAFLSENPEIQDWAYLRVNGAYCEPRSLTIGQDYQEGAAFEPANHPAVLAQGNSL